MSESVPNAIEALTACNALAIIWVDADLNITQHSGALAGAVAIGARLDEAFPTLFGLETDLDELRLAPGRVLELANTQVITAGNDPAAVYAHGRIDTTITWDSTSQRYVVLLVRALSWQPLQHELEQNVRRRRMAEELLLEQADDIRQTNETLARLNEDLAEFAHVVSHDLKGPMRALRYFADDLEASLQDPAQGDPRAHLARLKAQSRRMTAMLTSLLAFAKLEQKDSALECVDTDRLVRDIVASLPIPTGTQVTITGTWPQWSTLLAPLDLALRNLVENALKHACPDGGHVALACRQEAERIVITVADNGPGIPLQSQAAIFKPFTQLQPASSESELEDGTGMGLALVKRAVERVGGAISVRSDPSSEPGTEFTLAWPRPNPAISRPSHAEA